MNVFAIEESVFKKVPEHAKDHDGEGKTDGASGQCDEQAFCEELADEAVAIGLADLVVPNGAALDAAVRETCNQVLKCAPEAVAITKRLMLRAGSSNVIGEILDDAAASFAAAVRGPEGREGTAAFVAKRKPSWVTQIE